VFVKDDVPVEQALALRERLAKLQGVQAAQFISKEDALAEFRAQLGQDSDLLDVLEENPLPASMRLQLAETAQQSDRLSLLADYIASCRRSTRCVTATSGLEARALHFRCSRISTCWSGRSC